MTKLPRQKTVKLTESKILRREDITEDLLLMWVEKPDGFRFEAGQYCTIGRSGIERAYSIVSAPHEDYIELFVELVPPPTGVLTPLLWDLKPGDTVSIRPRAKGLFKFKPDLSNQLLVATVTGVVPYISFIREYLHKGNKGHHFYLLHGASYFDEFAYKIELETLAHQHPGLITYVPTVSRPNEPRNIGWSSETGRVNSIVDLYVEKLGLRPEDTIVYACGHPGMIEDVKERLLPRGFRIQEERFWKD